MRWAMWIIMKNKKNNTFSIEKVDGSILISIKGEMTFDGVDRIRSELDQFISDQEFKSILVDLSNISFMDSTGIRFLVLIKQKMTMPDRPMYLLRPSSQVRKVLDLVQLLQFFEIVEDWPLSGRVPS